MHIVQPSLTANTISFIPKSYITDVIVKIVEVETKVETISDRLFTTTSGNYLELDLEDTFKEGSFYKFDVIGDEYGPTSGETLYRGVIYATDTPEGDYKDYNIIDNDDYITPPDNDNTIITI